MTEVDRLGWAATVPLRAGAHVLGVRVNSVAVGEVVRERFAERLVPDAAPPGNLSMLLAPPVEEGPQPLHRLYVSHELVVRTRSAQRALDALWHELDVRDVAAARGRILLDATVVVRAERAHVLPPSMRREIVDGQRRWQAEGFQVVDRRIVALDLDTGTVTIDPSRLPSGSVDGGHRASMALDRPPEGPRPVGRFPIASWVLAPGSSSLAGRVVDAAGQVIDRVVHDGVTLIGGLAELLADLPVLTASFADEVRSKLAAG